MSTENIFLTAGKSDTDSLVDNNFFQLQLKQVDATESENEEEVLIKCNNIHLKCLLDVLDHILLYG